MGGIFMNNIKNDFSIVGGGIGGSSIAVELSKRYKTTLFEKEPYLGGCASTFKKKGEYFNAGATTFSGFDKGYGLYDFFDRNNIEFKKQRLDFALCVLIEDKKIYRHQDFDKFLNSVNYAFPHKKNYEFWKLVYEINKEFYLINDYYYSQKNIFNYLKSIYSFKTVFFRFYKYIFTDAKKFIDKFFDGIDEKYLDFLDNQTLVAAQCKTSDMNFFTAALALGYHFQTNYYIYGGMGAIFEQMALKIDEVKTKTKIESIRRENGGYLISSKKGEFFSKNLVLNSTIFDSLDLFEDKEILNHLKKYQNFDEAISAFTVYISLNDGHKLDHHYQLIEKELFPYSISNSIFVSLGDQKDEKMKNSITISIHTKTSIWRDDYENKKSILTNKILEVLKERLNIHSSMIKNVFAGTPFTFKRFINRSTLGGIPVKKQNLFFRLASNETPIKGLYLVGDTSFAAQGWQGVMMGVNNLEKLLRGK